MLNVQNKNSSYFVEWIPNNVKSSVRGFPFESCPVHASVMPCLYCVALALCDAVASTRTLHLLASSDQELVLSVTARRFATSRPRDSR